MSLRIFHIIFIAVCVILSLYVGFWGFQRYFAAGSGSSLTLGILFLVSGVALVVYGVRAFQKLKELP